MNNIDKYLIENDSEDRASYRELHFLMKPFNLQFLANDNKSAVFTLRDKHTNKIRGGVAGYSQNQMMFIDILYVSEQLQHNGYGSMLVGKIEEEAVKRNCNQIYTDTFDFQALDFYLKLNYEVFGELDGYEKGYRRYFLQKKFV